MIVEATASAASTARIVRLALYSVRGPKPERLSCTPRAKCIVLCRRCPERVKGAYFLVVRLSQITITQIARARSQRGRTRVWRQLVTHSTPDQDRRDHVYVAMSSKRELTGGDADGAYIVLRGTCSLARRVPDVCALEMIAVRG